MSTLEQGSSASCILNALFSIIEKDIQDCITDQLNQQYKVRLDYSTTYYYLMEKFHLNDPFDSNLWDDDFTNIFIQLLKDDDADLLKQKEWRSKQLLSLDSDMRARTFWSLICTLVDKWNSDDEEDKYLRLYFNCDKNDVENLEIFTDESNNTTFENDLMDINDQDNKNNAKIMIDIKFLPLLSPRVITVEKAMEYLDFRGPVFVQLFLYGPGSTPTDEAFHSFYQSLFFENIRPDPPVFTFNDDQMVDKSRYKDGNYHALVLLNYEIIDDNNIKFNFKDSYSIEKNSELLSNTFSIIVKKTYTINNKVKDYEFPGLFGFERYNNSKSILKFDIVKTPFVGADACQKIYNSIEDQYNICESTETPTPTPMLYY